jgi:hypothetical protein
MSIIIACYWPGKQNAGKKNKIKSKIKYNSKEERILSY